MLLQKKKKKTHKYKHHCIANINVDSENNNTISKCCFGEHAQAMKQK